MIHILNKIIFINQSFDHSYGGPASSVPLLAFGLKKLGYNCALFSLNISSHNNNEIIEKNNLYWEVYNTLFFKSLMISPFFFFKLTHVLMKKNCIVHLNTPWNLLCVLTYVSCKLTSTPYIYCPRGSLTSWALNQNRIVKKFALILYQRKIIEDSLFVHTTSSLENRLLSVYNFKCRSIVIPNPVHCLSTQDTISKTEAKVKLNLSTKYDYLLFYSRINKVKGLDYLIEAFTHIKHTKLKLLVCGSIEDKNYFKNLTDFIALRGLKDVILFLGHTSPKDKYLYYSASDLHILPSHSENFGMSVADAFFYSTPVITSHNTPWNNLEKNNIGWNVDLCSKDIARCIDLYFNLSSETKVSMFKNCKNYVEAYDYKKISKFFHDNLEKAIPSQI